MQDKHTNSSTANKTVAAVSQKFPLLTPYQQRLILAFVGELLNNRQQPDNAATLPPVFILQPETTYLICREWQRAHESRVPDWHYVAGLLDGINAQLLDPESADALHFLAVLARFRGAMAREVQ